jgi:hypothetical protein
MKEKSYYQQLKPIVSKHIKHFTEDFTVYDKKELRGYKGEFIYGYRTTGSDIFLLTPCFKALEEVLQTGKSDYFTERGICNLKDGTFKLDNCMYVYAILDSAALMVKKGFSNRDEHFIHGKNGKIRKVKPETMLRIIDEHTRRIDAIVRRIHEKYNPSRHFYAA